jgi:hypothetical protein
MYSGLKVISAPICVGQSTKNATKTRAQFNAS